MYFKKFFSHLFVFACLFALLKHNSKKSVKLFSIITMIIIIIITATTTTTIIIIIIIIIIQ